MRRRQEPEPPRPASDVYRIRAIDPDMTDEEKRRNAEIRKAWLRDHPEDRLPTDQPPD